MLNRVLSVLDNEVGFCNPTIIVQIPLAVMATNILTYLFVFGLDFYQKPAEMLLK